MNKKHRTLVTARGHMIQMDQDYNGLIASYLSMPL